MNPGHSRASLVRPTLLVGASLAILFRLWTSFCFFPLPEWNSVRLAPTFMLRFGSTPYPGLDSGPVTTWIYGPMTLILNLPASLAPDSVTAVLIAGIITLLCAIVPVVVAIVAMGPPQFETTRSDKIWALLLCLALWPNYSLQYIQADNAALGFGLLSNVFLTKARGGNGVLLTLAGLCAALAVWSKQTAFGLVLAQWLWLGFSAGRRPAIRYAMISVTCALAVSAVFVAWFGRNELWLNLVRIPACVPYWTNWWDCTLGFWPQILGYVLLPAVGVVVARRMVWKSDSPWLLPTLSWLCLLPIGVMAIYKMGGAPNSLNGFLYLLPLGALTVVVRLRQRMPRAAQAWLAAGLLAILTQQLAYSPLLPLRPLTARLVEGEQLARKYRGQIYFPWHPLLTYFSEGRFYHAEDGLYTRSIAGFARQGAAARRDLPPMWSMSAIPGWRSQGAFTQLQPPDAQLVFIGRWSIYVWRPTPEPTRLP